MFVRLGVRNLDIQEEGTELRLGSFSPHGGYQAPRHYFDVAVSVLLFFF